MARCIICKKNFVVKESESTIGCPKCVKEIVEKVDRDIKMGAKYICHRCEKEFVIKKGKSTIACSSCIKDLANGESWKLPIPVESRFEILDLQFKKIINEILSWDN